MAEFAEPAPHTRRMRGLRTVVALVLREMSTTYGRSPGGYLWAVAEPAAGIALLSIVFSVAFKAPSVGDSFPIFYATGYLPFMLYSDVSRKVAAAIVFSRPLLMYPAVNHVDALVARFIVNLLTHILVFVIVMAGLLAFFGSGQTILDPGAILLSLGMAALLAFGIGVLNCALFALFPVWNSFWAVANRPLFILSAVMFTYQDVPAGLRDYIWLNPLIHIVGEMRAGFYPTYDGSYISLGYVMGWALVPMALGFALLVAFRSAILGDE